MKLHEFCTLGAFAFLCGCDGGSTTDDVVSYSELQSRIRAYQAVIDTPILEDTDPTPYAVLPTSGSADYTGVAVVGIGSAGDNGLNDFVAVGSSTLVANFSDQRITGSADNFYQVNDPNARDIDDTSGVAIAGNLTFALEQQTAGQNAYVGQITGSVTPTNIPEITVDLTAGGTFNGADAEAFVVDAFDGPSDVLATRD